MSKNLVNEIIGWYGTIAVIVAYGLVSFGLISAETLFYQILNATGAAGVGYISFKKKAYQPGVLNVVWGIIAIVGIVRVLIHR